MNKEFDSKRVYGDNDKYIKAKIKSHGDKININLQGKEIPKQNASYKYLSLIIIDSVIRVISPLNNNDEKCFQDAVTVALNYQKIEKIRK